MQWLFRVAVTARSRDTGPVQPPSHRGALPYRNHAVCGESCGETPVRVAVEAVP